MSTTMTDSKRNIIPNNPYRGIHPFEFIHKSMFFGREKELTQLFSKILFSRFVLLFGESGSGKSSLINAGLIPRLLDEGFNVEKLRLRPIIDEPLSLIRIKISDDDEFLPSVFCPDGVKHLDIVNDRIPCTIEKFAKVISEKSLEKKTVLIFDQFEELFTLFISEASSEKKSSHLRDAVFNLIYTIANDKVLPIKILILIREDFLGELDALSKNYPQVFDHRIRLTNLDMGSAKKAILGPFEKENQYSSALTESLAGRIINDLLTGRNDELIHPTHLQIICSRLWENFSSENRAIDENDYRILGEIKGILESFLKTELEKASSEGLHDVCVEILGNLITEAETRDVVSLEKLNATIDIKYEKIEKALKFMGEKRLINRTPQRETFYFEVASEYLIPPILKEADLLRQKREQQEAQRIADDEIARRGIEIARQVEAEAQRKYTKRLKTFLVILSIALCATIFSTIEFLLEKKNVEEQKNLALRQSDLAEQQKKLADSLRIIADARSDSVLIEKNNVEKQKELTDSTNNSLISRNIAYRRLTDSLKLTADQRNTYLHRFLNLTWENNKQERKSSRSRELALRAQFIKDENPERALKIVLRALGVTDSTEASRTLEAENALQNIRYADYPHLVEIDNEPVTSMSFLPDNENTIAVATVFGHVIIYSAVGEKSINIFSHNELVEDIAFSTDGKLLFTSCRDCKVRIYRIGTKFPPDILYASKNIIRTVAVSENNGWIATGGDNGELIVWNLNTRKPVKNLLKEGGSISAINFSPDNTKLISAGWDSTVHVWNTATWDEIYENPIKNSTPVQCAVFSPDSRYFVTAGFERVIKCYNSENGDLEKWYLGHDAAVNSIQFIPYQNRMVSAGADKSIIVWNFDNSNILWKINTKSRIGKIAVSKSGKRLAALMVDEENINIYYTDINELIDSVKQYLPNPNLTEEEERKYL